MIIAELRAVALIEDKDQPFVAQRFDHVLVGGLPTLLALLVTPAGLIERQSELLDRADDDLVGVVVGQQAANESTRVGVLLNASLLEAVELFSGLAVQVLAVDDEEALLDGGVVLQEGGGLKAGERLAAAGGVPDVAVSVVLFNALNDVFNGVDLIRPHHQQLLLAGDEDHVAADHLTERALGEELLGEVVEVRDLRILLGGVLVDGQESLFGIEGEVAGVVVGEVVRAVAIADDEKLDEAQQRAGVAVAWVVLVLDDLLHRPAGVDAEGLEFDLHGGHAVDQ